MNDVNAQVIEWLLETVTWLSLHALTESLRQLRLALPEAVEATLAQVSAASCVYDQ